MLPKSAPWARRIRNPDEVKSRFAAMLPEGFEPPTTATSRPRVYQLRHESE